MLARSGSKGQLEGCQGSVQEPRWARTCVARFDDQKWAAAHSQKDEYSLTKAGERPLPPAVLEPRLSEVWQTARRGQLTEHWPQRGLGTEIILVSLCMLGIGHRAARPSGVMQHVMSFGFASGERPQSRIRRRCLVKTCAPEVTASFSICEHVRSLILPSTFKYQQSIPPPLPESSSRRSIWSCDPST